MSHTCSCGHAGIFVEENCAVTCCAKRLALLGKMPGIQSLPHTSERRGAYLSETESQTGSSKEKAPRRICAKSAGSFSS